MSITFKEYLEKTEGTAIYARRGLTEGLMYATLGLVNEAEEFRQARIHPAVPDEDVIAEAGDVLWYVAEVANNLGVEEELLDRFENDKIDHRNRIWIGLACGELAGHVKKMWRDGWCNAEKEGQMVELLLAILFEIRDDAPYWGSSFGKIMQANVDKLASRKERGVLGGSGDHR